MRISRNIEIMVGVFVVLGFTALILLALNISNVSSLGANNGYTVKVYFDNIGGLRTRAPISMSGVKIGRVSQIDYNQQRGQAEVSMTIEPQYQLSIDTQASIYTAGLLGEQYISLEPGAEDEVLKSGDMITLSQSAMVLEEIIGKFMIDLTSK
ncbi:MAG TPA: outer membrane lipid asymmetry maintenance protein MlaD [Leucothrix mucor]|uniref:Outer membrane lipid asymmetry maintenance protein MlaD n=1 Tax=Leucothrix mucor TaxID=45248 RepID=A0A7V2T143_LEUMU|nr:outer membrane lipid asymmetry maintenance protein MlaD [Leucothrix mucor]